MKTPKSDEERRIEISEYALILALIIIITFAAIEAYVASDFHFHTENVFTTIASTIGGK
jgi:hypothetical protein